MSILDTLAVTKYVAACAKKSGVSVKWEEDRSASPRTDGRTIWLPVVGTDEVSQIRIMNFVKHETSHVLESDFSVLEKHHPKGLLMYIMNLLEDHRVDYLNDKEYAGDKWNTEAYTKMWANSVDLSKAVGPELTCMAWDLQVRQDVWDVTDAYAQFKAHAGPELAALGAFSDELRHYRTVPKNISGEACYDLACRILRDVFGEDPKAYTSKPEEKKEKVKGKGAGEKGEEGKEKGSEAGDVDDKEGEGESGTKEDDPEAKPKYIDMEGKKVSPQMGHKPSGMNVANYTTGDSSKAYCPCPANQIRIFDFVKGVYPEGFTAKTPHETFVSAITKAVGSSSSLANELRKQLQVLSRTKWEYGKKKGVLHAARLHRIPLQMPEYSDRVLKNKVENKVLDVAIQLLVDCSGSMSGAKYTNASAAAIKLSQVFGDTLHIPVEVLGFTETYARTTGSACNTMCIFKEFDKGMPQEKMINSFAVVNRLLDDNVDGESIVFGYDRLMRRKEKRKVMVVLSDGSPCGGHIRGSTHKHTKQVVNAIEKERKVELYGVGIMYDCSGLYKNHDRIDSASEIEAGLLRLFNRAILGA